MYNSFDGFYNESYNMFYSTCKHKNCISENPIPYIIKKDLEFNGQYSNRTISLKNSIFQIYNNVLLFFKNTNKCSDCFKLVISSIINPCFIKGKKYGFIRRIQKSLL